MDATLFLPGWPLRTLRTGFTLGVLAYVATRATAGAAAQPRLIGGVSAEPASAAWQATTPAQGQPAVNSGNGPWLMYCHSDGGAGLLELDGAGSYRSGAPCLSASRIAGDLGFGVTEEGLVQLHNGEIVRPLPGEPAEIGWSSTGSFALLGDAPGGYRESLSAFDLGADRLKTIDAGGHYLFPMGWSPGGRWLVYAETAVALYSGGVLDHLGTVWAVSSDGRSVNRLFEIREGDWEQAFIRGWLSESSFVAALGGEWCDVALLHVNVETREVRRLYGSHTYAAVDPVTDTVFLDTPGPGTCAVEDAEGGLTRMTATGGWAQQAISLPERWREWRLQNLEWIPSLGRFAAWIRSIPDDPSGDWARLVLFTTGGQIQLELVFEGNEYPVFDQLFASPDGRWFVLGGTSPHGTRLYDAEGELIRQIHPSSPSQLVWSPGSDAFYMVVDGGRGLYMVARQAGWKPTVIEPLVAENSPLVIVHAPQRPYWPACPAGTPGQYSRLYLGDAVIVSREPELPSRLRTAPGLTPSVIGRLDPGSGARIVGGPACADNMVWWRLQPQRGGRAGWAAEGNWVGAWLLPVVRHVPRATVEAVRHGPAYGIPTDTPATTLHPTRTPTPRRTRSPTPVLGSATPTPFRTPTPPPPSTGSSPDA